MNRKILYVGNINSECSKEELAYAFNSFGYLKSVQIAKGSKYAFVEFEDEEDCAAAMDNMNGSEMNGSTLTVEVAYKGKALWEGTENNEEAEAGVESNTE